MEVFQAGDLIGFSGKSPTSDFVNCATLGIPRWGISHVGIVAEYRGRKLLFESTTLDPLPCEITGKAFAGTQAHRPEHVISSYHGRVWRYPLCRPLYGFESQRLTEFLVSKVGIPYDEVGAIRSGGLAFSHLESLLREQDLKTLFCSEYVAAALTNTGLMWDDNASHWSPNHLIRHLRREHVLLKPLRLK